MKVKLTLHRVGADVVDIVVTADSLATAGDVARRIAETEPAHSTKVEDGDVLTLAVAAPTAERDGAAAARRAAERGAGSAPASRSRCTTSVPRA